MHSKPLNQQTIMAWDPGGTTGLCIGVRDSSAPGGFTVLESHAIRWERRFVAIRACIEQHQPTHTVIESFTLYKHKAKDQIGSDFPSSQVIGIIGAYLYMCGLEAPVFQPASLIHGRPEVQLLPQHEPLLGSTAHQRDAYRHLRVWCELQAAKERAAMRKAG